MKKRAQKLFMLFWFWPFGSFLMAVRNIRFKAYHPIIMMFAFVYGYSVYMYSGDVVRYAEGFEQIIHASWNDFFYLVKQSYTGEDYGVGRFGIIGRQPDIYALSLQFLVSRVTENARWFFAIVSLIYAWLFLKFLDELLPEINWTGSVWQKVFFVYLLVVVPFFYPVIGVRFWAALCIFMIFSLKYIKRSNLIYILWASSSVLFHFSFAIPVSLLLFYRFIKINRTMSMAIVVVSMVLFVITSNQQIANYISSSSILFEGKNAQLEKRVSGYASQEFLTDRAESAARTNWYVRVRAKALPYFLLSTFLLEFFGVLKWKENYFLRRLYPFHLIFFMLAMFTLNLGSIARFNYIFYILSLARYTIISGINPGNKSVRIVATLLLPILIIYVLVIARAGFYTVDPLLVVSPPFVLFFIQSKISLSEFLIGH